MWLFGDDHQITEGKSLLSLTSMFHSTIFHHLSINVYNDFSILLSIISIFISIYHIVLSIHLSMFLSISIYLSIINLSSIYVFIYLPIYMSAGSMNVFFVIKNRNGTLLILYQKYRRISPYYFHSNNAKILKGEIELITAPLDRGDILAGVTRLVS